MSGNVTGTLQVPPKAHSGKDGALTAPVSAWIWLIVFAGLALRAYHYFRNPILWHDEAALVVNVISKGYHELLGPLLWHEAAPPLFLWIERTVYLSAGDNLQVLRVLPFAASCASLLLMVPICRRCLPASSIPWAIFLFACSESLLWHCCEAKPYALDVFAATLLLFTYLAHRHSGRLSREIVCYALLAPILIFLCYPACFLYGGVLLVTFARVCRAQQIRPRLWFGILGFLVLTSFMLLVVGPAKAQRDGAMESCWVDHFPDWNRAATVPLWAVVNSAEVVRYCLKPFGQALSPFVLAGVIVLWRSRQRELLTLLVAPLLLVLLASCLGAYPYGPSRVVVFLAPAMTILLAVAIPVALRWTRQLGSAPWLLTLLLLLSPAYGAVRCTVAPWPRAEARASAAWIRTRQSSDEAIVTTSEAWAYHYYLRDHRRGFIRYPHHLDQSPHQAGWAVHLEHVPESARLRRIERFLPGTWNVVRHQHFRYVTVARIERRSK